MPKSADCGGNTVIRAESFGRRSFGSLTVQVILHRCFCTSQFLYNDAMVLYSVDGTQRN
jgi:hypothetical protein